MGALRTLRDSFHFMACFLRSPLQVASLFPSSKALSQAMVTDLPLASGDVIVELGPGTGPITEALSKAIGQVEDVRCLLIEREPGFCKVLRERYPQMIVHQGHVEDVAEILTLYRLPAPKVILGGLPYAAMPEPVVREMLQTSHAVLAEGGVFRTFNFAGRHLLPGSRRLRQILGKTFHNFAVRAPVWRNLPPAFVMTGWKGEQSSRNGHGARTESLTAHH